MGHVCRRTWPFLVALALLASVRDAGAVFTSTATASPSPSTASCFYRATVQTGTTTSTGNGTTTVTITSVNTSRAFLLFTASGDQSRPITYELGGRIATSTTLEFIRVSDNSPAVNVSIRWYVVEYNCGVTVQRGSFSQTATSTDITISAVPSLNDAFVTYSKTVASGDQTYGDNDPLVGELTTTTNLQFRVSAALAAHNVYWQVVSFDDSTKLNVQKGSSTAFSAGTVTSTNVTISAVNTARTFVLVNETIAAGIGADDLGSGYIRGRLTSTTNLALDRGGTNYLLPEVFWQVIELRDGSSVQSGNTTLASSTLSTNVTITAVTLARSTAFSAGQFGGGLSSGLTTYTADDAGGNANATFSLTSTTNLQIVRTNSVGSATFSWFVVSWGLP